MLAVSPRGGADHPSPHLRFGALRFIGSANPLSDAFSEYPNLRPRMIRFMRAISGTIAA